MCGLFIDIHWLVSNFYLRHRFSFLSVIYFR
nr:MAG TPA: hypothetical protein [Caudoviricetes sp.]